MSRIRITLRAALVAASIAVAGVGVAAPAEAYAPPPRLHVQVQHKYVCGTGTFCTAYRRRCLTYNYERYCTRWVVVGHPLNGRPRA